MLLPFALPILRQVDWVDVRMDDSARAAWDAAVQSGRSASWCNRTAHACSLGDCLDIIRHLLGTFTVLSACLCNNSVRLLARAVNYSRVLL